MSRKNSGIIDAVMRNHNIVIIIAVVLMIGGVIGLIKMPRNEFPRFTVRQGVVVGIYPGATSDEVEAQLTRTVENYIFGYQEVNKAKTISQSKDGIMYIFVELNDNVTNADQFWSKLKHGLAELKMTLPSGVMALVANADFGDTSALLITLSSETKSYKDLEEELKKLEAECRKIPATSKIKHYGLQKEKIFVSIKPELLNEYNIKSLSLLGSYQSNGMVSSAGTLKNGRTDLAVHLPSNFESEKDLANQIVYSDPNGNVVRLKNIATIERRYDEPDNYIKQNGNKSILLSLEMQPGNNIVEYGKQIDKTLSSFQKSCPKDIQVAKISELPKYVKDSVNGFMREFIMAIVAVILVTMILLPFRVASVAGLTVPISVLLTLCFLYFGNVELNTVSLASLILVLGMIVDNSIVVIDNHVEKIDQGYSSWNASIKSAKSLFLPIIFATLAIFAAYFPLGFMVSGTAGEFMQPIPLVVGIALAISVLVAMLLVPYLNFTFIKRGLKKNERNKKGSSFLDKLQKRFDFALEKAFKHPKTVIAGGLAIIAVSVLLFTGIDQKLFPEVERNQFAVEVYLPVGSSVKSTAAVVDSIETLLLKDRRVTNVTSFIGTSSPRFHPTYAPNMPSHNYGQLLINTVSSEATREVVNEYRSQYTDCFANAHVKWKILAMQGFKAPIEIRISSDSINDIRQAEAQVNEILNKTDGVEWVRTDWDQKQEYIKVNLDREKANLLGYSKSLVSTSLMIGLEGLPLTTIWEKDYPVEVHLQKESEGPKNIKTLENQSILSLSSFSSIPLRSIARFTPEWADGTIVRRNGVPTLTVLVDNDPAIASSLIFEKIRPQIDRLNLPDETSISYGGEYESQNETFVPMSIALLLSIALIFFILLFEFKKVNLALIIMSSMLLALPGAAIGLKIIGYPFSTTAFIGITSLCGMVIRNGIILVDYAREMMIRHKLTSLEAAIAAGKRRMRPIFLTSAAAAVGVIPMILSGSPLWGPMGTVICFGLLFAMVLTLFILPILFAYACKEKSRRSKHSLMSSKTAFAAILTMLLSTASFNVKAQTLSLDSCKVLALENNYRIKESAFDVREAEEQKKNAMTNYFPKVSAMGVAMRSAEGLIKGSTPEMNLPVYDGNIENLSGATQFAYIPPIAINTLNSLNVANVSASLPLYAGGRIRTGNKLASLGEDVSLKQQELTTSEVMVRTEELYWNIVSLTEKEKTLYSYRMVLDTLARDLSNYNNAGLIQRNDLLKVQLKQNELEINIMKLENGISLTKMALCQYIGIPFDSTLVLVSQPVIPSSQAISPDAQSLVSNRAEYALLNKALEAEELQHKMIRGEYLPQLSVTGTGMVTDVMDNTSKNALALVTLSIPISDWWGGSHKIKQQKIKIEKARIALENNTEQLALQITQTGNEVKENYFQIHVAEKSVEQAKENLKVSEDNYNAGTINISDLLEAQAIFQNARDSLTDAKCNYLIKMAKYCLSTGNYK